MKEYLTLKWGTLKGWKIDPDNAPAVTAFEKWASEPVMASCMLQLDTTKQTEALCELIDAIDGPIENDWTGKTMTKEQAKAYLRDYGK